tara:strand:+ start:103 stop:360 length:258 start_codon:yes stop_codon:yes gene_type:complete
MPFIKKSELKRKDEKIKFFNKEIDILEKFKQYVYHHKPLLFFNARVFIEKNYGEEIDPPYKPLFPEEEVKEVKIKLKDYSIYKSQ